MQYQKIKIQLFTEVQKKAHNIQKLKFRIKIYLIHKLILNIQILRKNNFKYYICK